MADIMELDEKLTANMYDLDKLFELATETWPEMYSLIKAKVQMDPSFVEQMWGVLSPNWALIIEDIELDLDSLYEELQEGTKGVDIMDWANVWRIFSDLRPELTDQIRLLGFQECNDEAEGFNEDDAWAMLCDMWRAVARSVTGELKKRGAVGKVEVKEILKILVQKMPELVSDAQKELGSTKSVWRVWMKENEGGEEEEEGEGEKEGEQRVNEEHEATDDNEVMDS